MANSREITPEKYHITGDGGPPPEASKGTHVHAGHEHSHGLGGHDHASHASTRSLRVALVLIAGLLVLEAIGGFLANSLALLADAGHLLTDVGALALSLFVAWFTTQPGSTRKTYGYLRWEILAAFINGATLLLISAWILFEAVMRVRHPEHVEGGLMLGVAIVGLVVNIVAARILHPNSGENLNVRGAYLHVLGDLLAQLGTVVAAILIRFTGWLMADPIVSFLTTALIIRGSWTLIRESVDILLESTPRHIDLNGVREQLEAIPGIESVHDLHVWSVTPRMVAMSAHAIVRDAAAHQHALEHIHDAMQLFGIQHVTVQLECDEMPEREAHLHV
ncbi:MAG TPA: cation diffusion facilitator family transporter [Gemmatimonadaceae bacterium]|jgi:cobalt-zinc-cadmium efflux system protein|nr:cation diffusion facilitator family transporter [Gemmatimonadaceae bacterium]